MSNALKAAFRKRSDNNFFMDKWEIRVSRTTPLTSHANPRVWKVVSPDQVECATIPSLLTATGRKVEDFHFLPADSDATGLDLNARITEFDTTLYGFDAEYFLVPLQSVSFFAIIENQMRAHRCFEKTLNDASPLAVPVSGFASIVNTAELVSKEPVVSSARCEPCVPRDSTSRLELLSLPPALIVKWLLCAPVSSISACWAFDFTVIAALPL